MKMDSVSGVTPETSLQRQGVDRAEVKGSEQEARQADEVRVRQVDAAEKSEAKALADQDAADIKERLDKIESKLAQGGVELKFKLREESGELQVEVLDAASEKVVRKLPPDELIKLSASMEEFSTGFLNRSF